MFGSVERFGRYFSRSDPIQCFVISKKIITSKYYNYNIIVFCTVNKKKTIKPLCTYYKETKFRATRLKKSYSKLTVGEFIFRPFGTHTR